MLLRVVEIPAGHVLVGWHRLTSLYGPVALSAAHLAPADRPWLTLCGRDVNARRRVKRDSAAIVLTETRTGDREPCRQCYRQAGVRL